MNIREILPPTLDDHLRLLPSVDDFLHSSHGASQAGILLKPAFYLPDATAP